MTPAEELREPLHVPSGVLCAVCSGEVFAKGLTTCSLHVENELGITYKQLHHWAERGYLRPEQARRGTGIPRCWPPGEVEIARRMARLTRAGVIPAQAAVFARESWPSGEIAPGIRIEVDR